MFKAAPNPNAARLFHELELRAECQQMIIDVGGLRSSIRRPRKSPGPQAVKDIKVMKEDPAAVEKMSDEIKQHYVKIFHV